jgi:hypothetical protein
MRNIFKYIPMEKTNRVWMLLGVVAVSASFACMSGVMSTPTEQTTQDPTAVPEITDNYFPLNEGAYWVYKGTVKWEINQKIEEKSLTWKMEVIETIKSGPIIGYAMKGYPSDLAWYEEGKERSDYAIVQVGPSRFYKADIEVLERLRNETDSVGNLIHESQQFLDIPLLPGKKFCEAEQITRADGKYCWIVHEEEQIALDGITGIPSETKPAYMLTFATLPDHTIIQFVPEVGITQYIYVHHGTVSEVDVKLTEYYPGNGQTQAISDNKHTVAHSVLEQ